MIEIAATEIQCDFQQDLIDLLEKHAPDVTKIEALAVAANLVGKIIAMQDGETYSITDLLAIVSANIKAGNAQALELALMCDAKMRN